MRVRTRVSARWVSFTLVVEPDSNCECDVVFAWLIETVRVAQPIRMGRWIRREVMIGNLKRRPTVDFTVPNVGPAVVRLDGERPPRDGPAKWKPKPGLILGLPNNPQGSRYVPGALLEKTASSSIGSPTLKRLEPLVERNSTRKSEGLFTRGLLQSIGTRKSPVRVGVGRIGIALCLVRYHEVFAGCLGPDKPHRRNCSPKDRIR
jgi:hypothetical protein